MAVNYITIVECFEIFNTICIPLSISLSHTLICLYLFHLHEWCVPRQRGPHHCHPVRACVGLQHLAGVPLHPPRHQPCLTQYILHNPRQQEHAPGPLLQQQQPPLQRRWRRQWRGGWQWRQSRWLGIKFFVAAKDQLRHDGGGKHGGADGDLAGVGVAGEVRWTWQCKRVDPQECCEPSLDLSWKKTEEVRDLLLKLQFPAFVLNLCTLILWIASVSLVLVN